MTPRTKNKNDKAWPDHWTVRFEWGFPGIHPKPLDHPIIVESRKHDVRVKGNWYQFDRHVTNEKTGTEWLDCFEMYPLAGWKSFRPGEVSAVRLHVVPKKPKAK